MGTIITTSYKWGDVDVTLSAQETPYDSSFCYALVSMFTKVVTDFNLNPELFIQRMADHLDIAIDISQEQ